MKKLIGITTDYLSAPKEGGYSKFPYYAVRDNYIESINKCKKNKDLSIVLLPCIPDMIDHYFGILNALIITGGDFDVDPVLYGEQINSHTVKTNKKRTDFELPLIKRFIQEKKPLLGICGGMQLINVALGGTLVQHIPDYLDNAGINHSPITCPSLPAHSVTITKNTLLHNILQTDTIETNSSHHQSVKDINHSYAIVNAKTEDGIIEGIEHKDHPFCLGLQWHPEFLVTANDNKIIEYFCNII